MFRLQYGQHRAAGKIRLGEQHRFRAFGRNGDTGRAKGVLPGIYAGQDAAEIHVLDFQAVSVSLAEAGGNFNIVAYDFSVLDIGERLVQRFRRQDQHAVDGGKGLIVHHFLGCALPIPLLF